MPRPSRRDAVLDAAGRLFLSKGYAGTTVRAIAEEAGTTTGAIYSSFAGKADMLGHLLVTVWQELGERMESVRKDPAGSATAAGFLAVRQFAVDKPEAYELLLHASRHPEVFGEMRPGLGEEVVRAREAALRAAGAAVRTDQASGRLPAGEDPRVLQALYGALIDGLVVSRLSSNYQFNGVDASAVEEAALRLVFPR